MKHPFALLALVPLAACLNAAEAQPRLPHRTPVVAPRSTQHVVQRGRGTWQVRCVASVGCEAPRAVPRCAPDAGVAAALRFADAIDRRFRLSGQVVAVRGRLDAGGGCTEMACPDGVCCNHCRGAVALTGTAASSLRQLALGGADDPAFGCRGDDSGMCCGTAVPTGDVVVRGVLRPVAGSGGQWRLESPTLCAE